MLALLAGGRTSPQIAHELVISPRTVGTHVQHILTKLGVENRTQAAGIAHRCGLVAPRSMRTSLIGAAADLGDELEPAAFRFAS